MRLSLWAVNAAVLSTIVWAATVGRAEQHTAPVLAHKPGATDLGALETKAALAPSAASVAALTGAYLDRDQPGLASAVVERSSIDVRSEPQVANLYARAL